MSPHLRAGVDLVDCVLRDPVACREAPRRSRGGESPAGGGEEAARRREEEGRGGERKGRGTE